MEIFTIATACVIVTICMARDPLFQRASVVENVQRITTNTVDIRSALFVPDDFFRITVDEPHFSSNFKHALLIMFFKAIPYDMSNILCVDGCKTVLKVRHIKNCRMTFRFTRSCFIGLRF